MKVSLNIGHELEVKAFDAVTSEQYGVVDASWDADTNRLYLTIEDPNTASARNYLLHEQCYRVELNQRWGQSEKVNWVEATSEEEARSGWHGAPVHVMSVRRATVDDLEEFLKAR